MLKSLQFYSFPKAVYTPLFTFCPQLETVFDLPSNTIDKAWMSILEIIYPVQCVEQPSVQPTTVNPFLQQFRRALKTYLFGWLRLQHL